MSTMTPMLDGRARSRAMVALSIAVAVDSIGAGVVLPIFTTVFLNGDTLTSTGSAETRQFQLALAIAMYPLGMLIGAPILGVLSDRFGRRKLILLAMVGGAVMSIASGLAIAASALGLLLISRFIAGLFAGNMALARASAADLSGPDKRFVYISAITLAANGGFVISPLLGGFLGSANPATPFVIVGVLCLASAAVVAILLPETDRTQRGSSGPSGIKAAIETIKDRHVRNSVLSYLAFIVGWNIFFQFASVLLEVRFDATVQVLGIFAASVGIYAVIASSAVARWLNRRVTLERIVVWGMLVMIPTVLIFGFSHSAALAWLVVVPLTMASALASSGIVTRASELVGPESQGTVAGALSAMTALGWSTGPLLAALGALVGLSFTFVLAACAFGISLALFKWTSRPNG